MKHQSISTFALGMLISGCVLPGPSSWMPKVNLVSSGIGAVQALGVIGGMGGGSLRPRLLITNRARRVSL